MELNETLKKQLDHRTIRAFKEQILSQEQLVTLLEVARHTSTSMFMQGFSVMHITDPKKRAAIRNISTQPYVGANGDLFIFMVDLYRNYQIRKQTGHDAGRVHTTDIFFTSLWGHCTRRSKCFKRGWKHGLRWGNFRLNQ